MIWAILFLWLSIGAVVMSWKAIQEQVWDKGKLQVDLVYLVLGPIGIWRRIE